MNFLDIDWADFIERLTEWERLSLAARKAFMELRSNQGTAVTDLDGCAPVLVAAGLLAYCADRRRVKIHEDCRAFAQAIRAMGRFDPFGSPNKHTFCNYLHEHFTRDRRHALTPHRCHSCRDEEYLLRHVRSVVWVRELMATKNGSRLSNYVKSLLNQPGVLKVVQKVVGQFKTFAEPISLVDLPQRFPTLPAERMGTAILAGIQSLLLFPAMRPEDMMPVIGLWPTITQRLHRPEPTKPSQVEPDETYHSALLLDDMTNVLVAATARPLRIRDDGTLFVKDQREIVSNLVSAPDWIDDLDGCSPSERVDLALRLLRALEYVETTGEPGKARSLQSTNRSVGWLARCAKGRLMTVLDQLNPDRRRMPQKGWSYTADRSNDLAPDSIDDYNSYADPFPLIPSRIRIKGRRDWQPLAELAKAFQTLRGDDFVLVEEFLNWRSQEFNPLLRLQTDRWPLKVNYRSSMIEPTDEEMEVLWRELLEEFAHSRLFPLGGLRMGIVGRDRCISLTDAGRYLLGLVEDFDYGPEHEEGNPVLVLPNFDIVFTAPSPQAEASIGRFSEREGQRMGTLFKITKTSILAAASIGMTAQQVLETLRDTSAKEIPVNVKREILGWFDRCRRVTVGRATLVHCPDARTAGHVLAAGGKRATAIPDTVIELAGSKCDAALFCKLDAMGIFVDKAKSSAKESSE